MKTVGGKALADIGQANSVSVGKAEALDVITAVLRDDSNPFGSGIDGHFRLRLEAQLPIRSAAHLAPLPLHPMARWNFPDAIY